MHHIDHDDHDPATAELLEDAYVSPIDVETAARHLWVIHTEAATLQGLRAALPPRGRGDKCTSAHSELDRRHTGRERRLSSASPRGMPRALAPLLAIMMMLSTSGVAFAASQGSLPGDVLYAVKRGTESAQLVFARSPAARAQLQLAFAQNRLEEIRKVGDSRPEQVPALLADIGASLSEVERSAPESAPDSDRIRQQTTEQIAQLTLPAEVTKAVEDVISTTAAPPVVASQTTVTDPPKGVAAEPRVAPQRSNDADRPAPAPVITASEPPAEVATAVTDPPEQPVIEQGQKNPADDEATSGSDGREVAVSQSAAPDDPAINEDAQPTPVPPSAATGLPPEPDPPPAPTDAPISSRPVPTTGPVVQPPVQPTPTPTPLPAPKPVAPPTSTPGPPLTPPTLDIDVIIDGEVVPQATPSVRNGPAEVPVGPAVAPAQ